MGKKGCKSYRGVGLKDLNKRGREKTDRKEKGSKNGLIRKEKGTKVPRSRDEGDLVKALGEGACGI